MPKPFRVILSLALSFGILPAAAAVVEVPPGNRNAEQPTVPGASAKRTRELKTTFDAKYRKVHALLKNDEDLRAKIRDVSRQYGISPLHIAGAIVGEHTYNVDAYDHLQTYYVKAVSYFKASFTFAHGGETVSHFVKRAEFAPCGGEMDSYDLWTCREGVWNRSFRGRTVDGQTYPNGRFSAVFFQPFYAGQTFGIGQLNPLTALQMSDLVHEVSGLPRLDPDEPQQIYRTIMDPDLTLPYVAATLKKSIEAYRDIAGYDISRNPGITATLYNVGDPVARARALQAENRRRTAEGREPLYPQENYYGWLVNSKIDELAALFPES